MAIGTSVRRVQARREEGGRDERESKDTRETPGEKRRQTVIILSNDTAYRYNFQTRTIISVEGLLLILFFFFLHLYIFIGKERGEKERGGEMGGGRKKRARRRSG